MAINGRVLCDATAFAKRELKASSTERKEPPFISVQNAIKQRVISSTLRVFILVFAVFNARKVAITTFPCEPFASYSFAWCRPVIYNVSIAKNTALWQGIKQAAKDPTMGDRSAILTLLSTRGLVSAKKAEGVSLLEVTNKISAVQVRVTPLLRTPFRQPSTKIECTPLTYKRNFWYNRRIKLALPF